MAYSPIFRNIWLSVLFLPGNTFAQILVDRQPVADSSVNHAIQLYTTVMGASSALYNGFEYKEIEVNNYDEGHPFYRLDDWATGAVFYDGQLYSGVPVMYDLVNDKVLIENPSNFQAMELINDKIRSFSLGGHQFVRLWGDTLATYSVRPGFYDMLFDGTVKVYVLRKKEIDQRMENRTLVKTFLEKNRYFIFKDGLYFPVKSRSSVMKVFHDQRSILRRLDEGKSMRFKRNRDHAMSQLAFLYDESRKKR